ncbi:unnamed protein product [Ranitomeya imitator]|uniref:Orn/DAP/Arg decarboxylase 2 C-terminal domain-containing protein n=1 Tax=Ranitomeya imitator TaxID=111125 RepID=A0ABN9LFH7_9NEOB|nr:unnamed protein product [Ranitomeya imitator]
MVHRFTLAQASTDLNGQRHRLIQTSRHRKSHHDILKGFRETFSENSCERTFIPLNTDGKEIRKLSYYMNDGVLGTFWVHELGGLKMKPLKDHHHSQQQFPSRLWGPCCTDYDLIIEEVNLQSWKWENG